MGMDVMGHNPTIEEGEYFRNNIWWWRPLWSWICDEFPQLVGDDPDLGHYNDGYGLDEDESVALADALDGALDRGVVRVMEQEFNRQKAELPFEDCKWCEATGIRTDEVGISQGMDVEELPEHDAIILGRTHGTCNACRGHGKTENFASWYHFSESNVKEFSVFLRHCGGFGIH